MEKYYYLYQITSKLNGKIYIGVHKTNDIEDGYMGSGKILKSAQLKYGIDNFEKEILEYFNNEEDMFSRETEYITEEFILRDDNYNIKTGGQGGWTKEECIKGAKTGAGGRVASKKNLLNRVGIFSDASRKKQLKYSISQKNLNHLLEYRNIIANSESIKYKIKEKFKENKHQQGEKNSMYGKIWITNGNESTRIDKEEIIPEGWYKGRIQKKK